MTQKKVFKITLDKVDYDEYIGFVVIAESKERALECMIMEFGSVDNVTTDNVEEIEEMDLDVEGVVMSSYNNG